jgi:hypothetical protein
MHKPRANSTNPNPMRRQLPSERLSKHKHPGLGNPISRQGRHRKKPSSRRSHHNMPTLSPLHQRGHKGTQSIDNPPQVDVKHPPPVLLRRVKKTPSNSHPSISHDNVRNPMLSKNVLSNLPHSHPIPDIKPKSTPPNLPSSSLSRREVNVNTKHLTPQRGKRDGGSPPNPTTGPSNNSQLPLKRTPLTPHPPPNKLPSAPHPVKIINKLTNKPSHHIGPIPNSPMLPHQRPPPKPLTPSISSGKNSGGDKRIPSERNLLHRSAHTPPPTPPPKHIGPIKLNPIPSVPIGGLKPPPQPRHPPNHLRHNGNLKSPNIPRTHPLPKNIEKRSPPHPLPHMPKIRPRDRGERGKQLRPLSNRGPGLNRPPVMSHKVHRPPNGLHNSSKIPDQLRDQVPLPPPRGLRPPSPPHVIPHHPKTLPQPRHHPIPNGRIVRIPVHEHHRRPRDQPILVDGQPHPTSLNPSSTHNPKVANTAQTPCAKLRQATSPRSSGDRALPSGGRCRRFKSCRGRTSQTCRNRR